MIERSLVQQKKKEFQVEEFVASSLKNVGHSHTKMIKTPLGEKIIVFASRPGLVVGREGRNINSLTAQLKKKFNLENPQIEINEVENINLDARIVAERIASSLERFGITRFKGIGHKVMSDVMNAGALGIEIMVSGKVPSSRAKSWRFHSGYIKKCGDVALGIDVAYATAELKIGTIGIQVRIMPPDIKLPDKIEILKEKEGEAKEEGKAREAEEQAKQAKTGEAESTAKQKEKAKGKTKEKEQREQKAEKEKEHKAAKKQEKVQEKTQEKAHEKMHEKVHETAQDVVDESAEEADKTEEQDYDNAGEYGNENDAEEKEKMLKR